MIGSGSNLLVADEGVRGLVLKLERELARIEPDGDGLRCGGGARLPAVAARAAALGLAGIEFAVNIPGHRRRRGADERQRLRRRARRRARLGRDRHRRRASRRRGPDELGFGYRRSGLRRGGDRRRARASRSRRAPPESIRATLAAMRERRHAAQPKGIRTFGSTFKNPPGTRPPGELLAAAGVAELAVGGARFSRKHANFVENTGGASTAEILALMAAGRERVRERFGIELEPEVQLLGDVRFPW